MTEPGTPGAPQPPVPARGGTALDRRAVERVLARAAELQAGYGSSESAEMIGDRQLVEIAREVGLDPVHVQRALAEERARPADSPEAGVVARLFGAGGVGAARVLEGQPADLLATLDRYMQREECMCVQRRFQDSLIWEPREDFAGAMRRALRLGGKRYELAKGAVVTGSVVPVDERRALVSLTADLRDRRRARLRAGGGVAATALAFDAVIMFAAPVAAALVAPIVVGAAFGWVVARSHRETVVGSQLALEQVLDRLEYGEARPPRTLAGVLEAAARPLLR